MQDSKEKEIKADSYKWRNSTKGSNGLCKWPRTMEDIFSYPSPPNGWC